MLFKRGAKTNPWGTPFFRRRNLHCLPLPVVSVKLLFWTSFMIIRIMCLSGRSLSSLRVGHGAGQTHNLMSDLQTRHRPLFLLQNSPQCFGLAKLLDPRLISYVEVQPAQREQWIDNGFDTSVNKSFEDLINDTKQRDQTIVVWVLSEF